MDLPYCIINIKCNNNNRLKAISNLKQKLWDHSYWHQLCVKNDEIISWIQEHVFNKDYDMKEISDFSLHPFQIVFSYPNTTIETRYYSFSELSSIRYSHLKRPTYDEIYSERCKLTPALRKQIAERDNYTCQYCGKYMPDMKGMDIDHIVPLSRGGKTEPSNLQVLCFHCNRHKNNK